LRFQPTAGAGSLFSRSVSFGASGQRRLRIKSRDDHDTKNVRRSIGHRSRFKSQSGDSHGGACEPAAIARRLESRESAGLVHAKTPIRLNYCPKTNAFRSKNSGFRLEQAAFG
jgi:hypothetical protein